MNYISSVFVINSLLQPIRERERERERDAIFGRDSYERKLSNHHDQGSRQGATAIIEFFSVTHTSKNFEGARPPGAPVFVEGGACATAQWHYG